MIVRTKEYRDSVRRHVLWDVSIFFAATELRLDPIKKKGNKFLYGIYTDSLLIHARSLYNFFRGNKKHRDDIVAADLVTDPNGNPWKATNLPFLDSIIDDINKYRAHLSIKRNNLNRKWSESTVRKIRKEIETAWHEFLTLIPESERNEWRINDPRK